MSVGARIGRLIAVVIVFVVIGPPVGAIVLVGLVEGLDRYGYPDLEGLDRHWVTLFDLILAVPVSYWYGTMPAAAAGLVIGVRQVFFGRATWPMALATGFVVALAVLDRSGQHPFAAMPGNRSFPASAIVMLACLVATMACWGLVRNWYVAAPRSSLQRSPMEPAP
jgi:hypothetical protein